MENPSKQCICNTNAKNAHFRFSGFERFLLVGKPPKPIKLQLPCELRTWRHLSSVWRFLFYEQQLREAETGIQNLLNAIQQGILTKSTKSRLEELEATKEELEIKIANEKITKSRISPEFVAFWLHKFRKLDVRQQAHRKMLIDTFVNAIYLYDDNWFFPEPERFLAHGQPISILSRYYITK